MTDAKLVRGMVVRFSHVGGNPHLMPGRIVDVTRRYVLVQPFGGHKSAAPVKVPPHQVHLWKKGAFIEREREARRQQEEA